MIPKIPINYYPLLNSGHTLTMAGKLDPWRMYCNTHKYEVTSIISFPDFSDFKVNGPFQNSIYTEYLLLQVNGTIDYSVLTSLN